MADRAQNLQDTFLNHVRKNKISLTIFLINGVKLQGVVTWFDNFCVLLRRGTELSPVGSVDVRRRRFVPPAAGQSGTCISAAPDAACGRLSDRTGP